MPADATPADHVHADPAMVRRLLAAQFPQWADLPVEPVASAGTDNTIHRLGADLVVRLPRYAAVARQVEKEHRWLPVLAPSLPLAVPEPLAKGAPGEGYPWPWAVHRWIEGENATADRVADPVAAATALAGFVAALQRIDPSGGPPSGPPGEHRGVPLAVRDEATRRAVAELDGMVDTGAVTAAWDAALRAPGRDGPPAWLHGDLQSGNLLARHGRLHAVIDFGLLAVGDPACDAMAAWTMFAADARAAFRAALAVDDATWARGRGWALSFAVIALPYYVHTNPVLAGIARHTIAEVLADHRHGA